ncbi:transcriptional regulator with XRE-family HTH domain [Croceifilum oryzae]|uniref:Transcriptional regulator with XRE-family HTH domain n=1 Tax=Croceifilum oryzae TaxID=1553429 RepID=A0AAJ1TET3_9BACL|nr:helix-turn-helix transcriptional regulator [Croceifilum oryzae]MDQ0417605.1 transcriptional regulator with XRE-family HTH domain [Croceifilum oryzae]
MEKTMDKTAVGERIVLLRKTKGWKRKDLATQIEVSWQVVTNLETGATLPTPIQLVNLSRVLNTSTDFILGVTSTPSPHLDTETLPMVDLQRVLENAEALQWGDRILSPEQRKLVKGLVSVVVD